MKKLILTWLLMALAIMFVAWLVPGISITGIKAALIVVIIMALVNALIKPILTFISLPLNILTLGLFGIIINALLFMLVAKFAPGFEIDGFWSALIGAVAASIFVPLILKLIKDDKKE